MRHLIESPDEPSRDDGEDDTRSQLEAAAVEPEVELVEKLTIGHRCVTPLEQNETLHCCMNILFFFRR